MQYPYILASMLLLLSGWQSLALAETIEPRVVFTHYVTNDVVVALVELNAPAENEVDASGMIQKAIDSVAEAGGGVVFLHEGLYRLEVPIIIREAVTLRGDWTPPPGVKGTILAVYSGRGEADGTPAITMQRGSGLREVSVWYPEQDPEAIVPYPWCIRTCKQLEGNNHTVMNATLVNPYQGFMTGPEFNELHTLRNVYATPLKTGIRIDMTTDIGRLIHVRFHPEIWTDSGLPGAPETATAQDALKLALDDAVGIDMGRSDWEYIYDVAVRGYGTGMRIRQGREGGANAVMFASQFTECIIGLELISMNNMGLAATASIFEGSRYGLSGTQRFSNVAQFNSSTFSGGDKSVNIAGNPMMSFQNCAFTNTIRTDGGGITILNSDFNFHGENEADTGHIFLDEFVSYTRILGNRFDGEPQIINNMLAGDCMITHQDQNMVRPSIQSPDYSMPHPRPKSYYLVCVSDFGATPESEDNTEAFQKALDAMSSTGGTVYVPAGNYLFQGELRIPSGVELRGCFDVPHHTVSGGSILMPLSGRGNAEGTPFIQLEAGSGIRGITIWYPEQGNNQESIVPYPWSVRSLGPECWLVDVTIAPSYQGVDFWTHPSDGHVIQYLAGAFLRKGLSISKADTNGWVEDIQFNPHYAFRLHNSLTQPNHAVFGDFVDYQREHLEGMKFGRSANQRIYRNFLYGAYDGLAFRDDDGGTHAHVVMQGVDTVSRSLFIEKTDPKGIELINTQLVPLSNWEVGAIVTDEAFDGDTWLFNTQVWAGTTTAVLEGSGTVVLQQLNTISGEIFVDAGTAYLENMYFQLPLSPYIDISPDINYARVLSNSATSGRFEVKYTDEYELNQVQLVANSTARRPPLVTDEPVVFNADWRQATPQPAMQLGITAPTCNLLPSDTPSGNPALRISGSAPEEGHAHVYFILKEAGVPIASDTIMQYWIKPENELSRNVAIDLLFTDGSTLRDSETPGAHPAQPRGTVGEWALIRQLIGREHAGKEIFLVFAAFDSNKGPGEFVAFLADLSIGSEGIAQAFLARAEPAGGFYTSPLEVMLIAPEDQKVRYTLDGSNPDQNSMLYTHPIILRQPGITELRYSLDSPEMQAIVFGEMYTLE